jgi:CRP/FNR family transcriptional regulator, nitrogen oxide reductase regulator
MGIDANSRQRDLRNPPVVGSRKSGGQSSLLSGILPGDSASFTAAAHPKTYQRGEMLFIEGDVVQQIVMLTSGIVKITQLGRQGTEVILHFGIPGDVLGAVGLFSTGRHGTTAQSFRSCQALVWEAPVFRALVEKSPVLHQNMVSLMGEYLEELEERFREVSTEKVAQRVASQLVRLAGRVGTTKEGSVEVELSREELAQMTGTTLFTVSRLLSAWESRGFVKPQREAVIICDLDSIALIAEQA